MNVESLQIQKMYYSYLYYKKWQSILKGTYYAPFYKM